MKPNVRIAPSALSVAIVTALTFFGTVGGDEAGPRDIPAPFAPFEFLVGGWNGTGSRKDDPALKFRGWNETHTWAWKFAKGKPAALTFASSGGRILATATLTYESARHLYRLEGNEPGPGHARVVFEGTLQKTGNRLDLDRINGAAKNESSNGTMRLSIWPNANSIRYTMAYERKEPGSIRFARLIEVGLTKDGESLAGTAAASERPKCIVTGGAATMTMTYQGRTFPICCTGCRDEFQENPEKYIKKASLTAASATGRSKPGPRAASTVSRFEDAFANDVVDMPKPTSGKSNETRNTEPDTALGAADAGKSNSARGAAKVDGKSAVAKNASRAASLLKLGQNLERAGNTNAALGYYRRVVKEFAKTPAAKTAAQRIKTLSQP